MLTGRLPRARAVPRLWNCGSGTVDAAELDAIADYLVRGGGLFSPARRPQGDACAEMMRVVRASRRRMRAGLRRRGQHHQRLPTGILSSQ